MHRLRSHIFCATSLLLCTAQVAYAEQPAPMAIAVIGGLILSTMLTLLIVPAGFSLADGFEKRVGPWLRTRMLTYKEGDDRKGLPGDGTDEPGLEPAE